MRILSFIETHRQQHQEEPMEDDDEATVITGNLDQRPARLGKQEKLKRRSEIMTEEERSARDREMIQMYTRKKQNGNKFAKRSRAPSSTTSSSSSESPFISSNKSLMGGDLPQHHYPYYDLVIQQEPSAEALSTTTADVILPPMYSTQI
jgi:hypothetical protein